MGHNKLQWTTMRHNKLQWSTDKKCFVVCSCKKNILSNGYSDFK